MPNLQAIQLSNAARLCRPAPFLLTNRVSYHDDDPVIQVIGTLAIPAPAQTWSLTLIAVDPVGTDVTLLSHLNFGPLGREFELLLESSVVGEAASAAFGRFRLRVEAGTTPVLSNEFARVQGKRHPGVSIPTSGIALVTEQAPDYGPWPITTAVPFPVGALSNSSDLALFDEAGARVPAQIETIADWYRSLGTARSVKWASIDFVAQCRRARTTRYTVRSTSSPLPAVPWIADGTNAVEVDTGLIRFTVKKRAFNGIERLERWTDAGWRTVAQNGMGPYLEVRAKGDVARPAVNRILFTAADDPTARVRVIKAGDVAVTIRAEGDYYHAGIGSEWANGGGAIDTDDERRHCHFVIDLTAYRGCSQINIASTLVITYDPGNVREDLSGAIPDSFFASPQEREQRLGTAYVPRLGHWWKQPIDIGWDWGLAPSFERGYLGYETENGATVWNADPWTAARVSIHQFRPDRCAVVNDAFDGLRYDVRRVAAGLRSEGWATADLGHDALTITVRDIWQRFPKEIAIRRDERAGAHLTVHTWPRHGYGPQDRFSGSGITVPRSGNVTTFPDDMDDTLSRAQIWKLPFAHEGETMDLRVPTDVVKRWIELNRGGVDLSWDLGSIEGAVSRTAQGIGTTTELALLVHDGSAGRDVGGVHAEARRFAAFWQSGTHALPESWWSGDTRAEGRFDGPSPAHPAIEEAVGRAIDGWRGGLGGVQGCYGMWIYGSVHNNWMATALATRAGVQARFGVPQLHRLWQASHYRNVWMAWLLYLRSGDRGAREWALATSRLFADVGTIHREPMRPPTGRFAGDFAHVYAITPWGTAYERFGHWIDPDAHRLRFILVGDLYAKRLYDLWWENFSRDLSIGAGFGRETTNTLGSIADYYALTQDPSALVLLRTLGAATFATRRHAGAVDHPFYDLSGSPGDHAVWNRRWLEQYFDLTGDADAVRFAVDFVEQTDATPAVAAFAYLEMKARGPVSPRGVPIVSYLHRHLSSVWDMAVRVLDTNHGPYHGYGDHFSAARSHWLQEWPFFLRALRDANIQTPGQVGRRFKPPGTVATSPTAPSYERIAYPTRSRATAVTAVSAYQDWRNSSLTVYALSDDDFEIHLQVQGGTNVNQVTGFLSVHRYDPQAAGGPWISAAPPGQAAYSVSFDSATPLIVPIHHVGRRAIYQIHLLPVNAAPVKAPLTGRSEVLELRGPGIGPRINPPPPPWSDRIGSWIEREAVRAFGRQLWYIAAEHDAPQPTTIVAQADPHVLGNPCAVFVQTSRGIPVAPRHVIPKSVPLGPYEYNGRIGPPATAGGPVNGSSGIYQLASHLPDDSKVQVAFVINTRGRRTALTSPAEFFSTGTYGPILRLEGTGTRAFMALDPSHLEDVIRFVKGENVLLFTV